MEGETRSKDGKSRRDVLKALGAAAVGAVAAGVLQAENAEAGHGAVNGTGDGQFRPGVHGFNPDPGGVGVEGSSSVDGIGVWGRGGYIGVQGTGSLAGILGDGSGHSTASLAKATSVSGSKDTAMEWPVS